MNKKQVTLETIIDDIDIYLSNIDVSDYQNLINANLINSVKQTLQSINAPVITEIKSIPETPDFSYKSADRG